MTITLPVLAIRANNKHYQLIPGQGEAPLIVCRVYWLPGDKQLDCCHSDCCWLADWVSPNKRSTISNKRFRRCWRIYSQFSFLCFLLSDYWSLQVSSKKVDKTSWWSRPMTDRGFAPRQDIFLLGYDKSCLPQCSRVWSRLTSWNSTNDHQAWALPQTSRII